tara:strand:+ start:1830 stop:2678 length:849 start_codon:yes stop_codon:yes gene_type:complete
LSENIIIIPIYNDWKSLNKLLVEINQTLNESDLCKVLIVNDSSTQKINIQIKNLNKIKEIKILTTTKNLGSQKSISIGLNYLKRLNDNFFITIMDGDGEDNPSEMKQMLDVARTNQDYIVTSHRKDRNENFIIKFSYKIHLMISFFLTWHWISFGNFSCFNSNNLKKINLHDTWYAFSAGVLKNCKIKKLYASRQKRYFESSKVNFLKLIEHSTRIISVFYQRMFATSLLLVFIIWFFIPQFNYFFYILIFLTNLIVILIKIKNFIFPSKNLDSFIADVKIL